VNPDRLLAELRNQQQSLLDLVRAAGPQDCRQQFHRDLSPLGWHLGHCVYTEIFWIRETVLGQPVNNASLRTLYVPELAPKPGRGADLPEWSDLLSWAAELQLQNTGLLADLFASRNPHPLMQDRFLPRFLVEHWSQHVETAMYILAQRALQQPSRGPAAGADLEPKATREDTVYVPAGRYGIGAAGPMAPYDNERPAFSAPIESFRIARRPVSNAEYLTFIDGGGYDERRYWTAAGWQWRMETRSTQPEHWRRNGSWYAVDEHGARVLEPDAPLSGISHHEAVAFARRAGARLPHEYEWETACRLGLLEETGQVWEWCANIFHPYRNFAAWPYEGYSRPYFDGRHRTLRGGSRYTREPVRRATFRNWYQADKRHVCAGMRLVYDH
jgi:iron(II)-dependent oxidoreductase